MSFIGPRLEAWQSYKQAWAKKGWTRMVAYAEAQIRLILKREAEWRKRVYG